jgi:creatinine amidohydrolase/Fe(II)-dependent formamide hydrolase-like protein
MRRIGLALWLFASTVPARAQVRDARELNTEQFRSLDRTKTAVILVGGILEQHGPYLPSYSDGYWNERVARDLAEAIAARGWNAVMYPPIPLGQGGANIIGGKHSFPGSFNVRTSTLRAVYMDLADSLGEQGFRWVFVVDGHGSPNHNGALDAAGAYFHDSFGGRMVHLYGLQALRGCCEAEVDRALGEAGRKQDGFTVHAGAVETAGIAFLRPELVAPAVLQAPALTGAGFSDLVRMARQNGWPGYFGSPRLGSAALGAVVYRAESAALQRLALRVLDGWDPSAEKRYFDAISADPDVGRVLDDAVAEEQRRERRQRDWLDRKAKRAQ